MKIEKKHLFGFENQGTNYELYRPTYRDDMIEQVLKGVNL